MVDSLNSTQTSTENHSLRWIGLAMAVGVLATGGAIFFGLQAGTDVTETTQAQSTTTQPISALGRIAPIGETFKLSATSSGFGGAKLVRLLVREGDVVKQNQPVAVLDSFDTNVAALITAQENVRLAEAELAIVKAGAKPGAIAAQQAQVAKAQAQLQQEYEVNQASLATLIRELEGEKIEQQATIDRLEAELRQAQIDDQRYKSLAESGAIALADWEARRLALETTKQRLSEAQARLQKTDATLMEKIREQQAILKKDAQTQMLEREAARATLAEIQEVRAVDVQKAEAEVRLALAQLQEAKTEVEQSVVKAPVDSQVLKIYTRPGEKIDDAEGIADLGITSQMIVIAEVYENDIARVEPEQIAWISSENGSFAGELEGRVMSVGLQIGKNDVLDADPAADIDARVVEVKIQLSPQASKEVQRLTNANVFVKIEPNG